MSEKSNSDTNNDTKVDTDKVQAITYEPRALYKLNISDLSPDPNQPRKFIDQKAIDELAASIKLHEVLQPILFRQGADGKLIIVSGERRYRASIDAKKKTIPAIFIDSKASEIALIENLLREDLTPLEEAEGLLRLQKESGYKNKELAAVIGKAESTISEILSLNNLPKKIKKQIHDSKEFSRRQLVEVAKGKDDKEMFKIFNKIKVKKVSSDELRQERQGSRDDVAVFKTLISSLTGKLNKGNLNELGDEKCELIKSELKTLANLITDIIK